jgi:hypothetical protein
MSARARAKAAAEALIEAVSELHYDPSNRPASQELRVGWPDLGRAWIRAWAEELGRDMSLISDQLGAARSSEDAALARTALENALWRLDSAREKLHTVVALIFGVPSLRIGTDKKQTLSFRADDDETRAKLKELQADHDAAAELLRHDATLKGSLLLRHQIAHSLAPVVNYVSLTWFQRAIVERGGINHYMSHHLPARGLEQMTDVGDQALFGRSLRIAQSGLRALTAATNALADLTKSAGQLEPPPTIWYVVELSRSFADRAEALDASRRAAGLPPVSWNT